MTNPPSPNSSVVVPVGADEILHLRHAVLRPHLPVESVRFAEDELPDSFHLGVHDQVGVVACVTFFPDPLDDRPAWRLRGMATAAGYRNRGIGGELLEAGVAEVVRRGGSTVWCNGRSAAATFYHRHGFVARGPEFVLHPVNIPHYVFVRVLGCPGG